MKPARIIALVIAVVAGAIAAQLAGRSEPPPAPAPVAQLETTDVLIANSDIGFSSRELIRVSTLINSRGSGYLAGILPSGMGAISVDHDEIK
jgi:Flp pilus assembly protein CpaB